ncbi:MAG: DUF493 domain-containing protein [Legionellaceae bacterium]|nr:DUF493 domain-containing protein [Legionellaceae bacterium]
MSDSSSLIKFPSDFLIKIIGEVTEQFEQDILDIAHKHHPELEKSAIQSQKSAKGNYLAISITVHAVNQHALDALYEELSKHPDTKMVL